MEIYLFFLFLFIIYNIFYYFNTSDLNNTENNLIKEKDIQEKEKGKEKENLYKN